MASLRPLRNPLMYSTRRQCMRWAQHRRSKAAAKLHLNLDLQSFLPKVAIIDRAKDNDAVRARELCANIKAAEIVIADKAYIDFEHLYDLDQRDISWGMRAKDDMRYNIVEELDFTAGTGVELNWKILRVRINTQSQCAWYALMLKLKVR